MMTKRRTYIDANAAKADEFASGEKPIKPMFRVTEIKMRSLREVGS